MQLFSLNCKIYILELVIPPHRVVLDEFIPTRCYYHRRV